MAKEPITIDIYDLDLSVFQLVNTSIINTTPTIKYAQDNI